MNNLKSINPARVKLVKLGNSFEHKEISGLEVRTLYLIIDQDTDNTIIISHSSVSTISKIYFNRGL